MLRWSKNTSLPRSFLQEYNLEEQWRSKVCTMYIKYSSVDNTPVLDRSTPPTLTPHSDPVHDKNGPRQHSHAHQRKSIACTRYTLDNSAAFFTSVVGRELTRRNYHGYNMAYLPDVYHCWCQCHFGRTSNALTERFFLVQINKPRLLKKIRQITYQRIKKNISRDGHA